jgi:alpha-aminoadipate carrier protein LysW
MPETSTCPVCEADVQLADGTVLAELIVCSCCSAALEVRSLNPAKLEEAPQEEEDWGE